MTGSFCRHHFQWKFSVHSCTNVSDGNNENNNNNTKNNYTKNNNSDNNDDNNDEFVTSQIYKKNCQSHD